MICSGVCRLRRRDIESPPSPSRDCSTLIIPGPVFGEQASGLLATAMGIGLREGRKAVSELTNHQDEENAFPVPPYAGQC